MRIVASTFKILLALLVVFVAAFIVANLHDENLSLEVNDLLKERPTVTTQSLLGFKYLLGLRVAPGQDPATAGERFYQRLILLQNTGTNLSSEERTQRTELQWTDWKQLCGPSNYCSRNATAEQRAQIDHDLSANLILLSRLESLLDYGSVASDLAPAVEGTGSLSSLLSGAKWYRLQLSIFIQEGRAGEAFEKIRKFHSFVSESLNHAETSMDALILASILKSNRDFAKEASREDPTFQKLLISSPGPLVATKFDFERLAKQIIHGEVSMAQNLLQQPFAWEQFNLTEDPNEKPWLNQTLDFMAPVLFKKNKTLNLFEQSLRAQKNHPCVQGAEPCPNDAFDISGPQYFVNPLGRLIVAASHFDASRFQKLRAELKELSEPLPPE